MPDTIKDFFDNKEEIIAAVSKYRYNLQFASDRLKGDKEVVMAAVSNDGIALQFASQALRGDIDFCIECAKKTPNCIPFMIGEAAELFANYHDNLHAIETFWQGVKQQQQANEILLAKLKQTHQPEQNLFKRRLNV